MTLSSQFATGFPDELKPRLQSLYERWDWLFPLWVQTVTLVWIPEETDFTARCRLYKDYRAVHIDISPMFISELTDRSEEIFVHEIVHCFNIPLKTVCMDALSDLKADESVTNMLERQINKVMEQITQDFAFVLLKHTQAK